MKKLFKKLMAMLLTITLFTGMFPAVMASGEGTDETVDLGRPIISTEDKDSTGESGPQHSDQVLPEDTTESTDSGNACAHENTKTVWDKKYPFTYTSVSNTQHSVKGYQYRYCTSCAERVGDSFETEWVENHRFIPGSCTDCKYECTHSDYSTHLVGNITRKSVSETQHITEGIRHEFCNICGMKFNYRNVEELNDHSFDENGRCYICGYAASCAHKNTETAWDTNDPIIYSSVSNTQHSIKGYQYRYCTSCFKRIGDSFAVTEKESHTLDKSGNCTFCGYTASCKHTNTKYVIIDGFPAYICHDEKEHIVDTQYKEVCRDCDKVIQNVVDSKRTYVHEVHRFDSNGICSACKYVKPEEQTPLSVSVSAGQYSAKAGTRISAAASATGGDGYYSFAWKVMFNGGLLAETSMGYGSSYDYAAKQEGSYAFAVTVRDGSGNTATAQSSPITVKHIHDYKTVSSTELINQDTTFHNVVTTTYEECSICHHKTDPVAETVQKKHTAQSQGYEAAHPHKQYFVCKCGAHPYVEGKYKTANGKVQDAAVCCICHGHKWDDPVGQSNGSFKQICNRCGETQIVYQEQDACDHEYAVEYSDHPHIYLREYCKKCGRLMDDYGTYIDPVTGEEWTRMFGDNGRLRSSCEKCFPKKMNNDHLIDMANLSIIAYETRSIVKQAEEKMGSKKDVTLENIKLGDKEAQEITVSKIGGGIYQINSHDQSGLRITAGSGLPDSYIYVEETVDGELVLNIAFEGTIDVWDWITDFSANANNDGLHSGFGQVAKKYLYSVFNNTGDSEYKLRCTIDGVWKDWSLAEILSECANPERNGHIRITGHSLGGAAAQCLAYYLMSDINGDEADSYFPWGREINKEKIEVYTYASPIPFSYEALEDERFRNVNVYNIINVNDSAPDVGVTMSDFLVTRFAEAAGAAAAGIMSQENYNGGFSTAGSNMGTNIYLSSDNLANWEESGIAGNHNMSATYLKLVQEYVDGTIPAYTLNTDILRSDSYILNNHEETKAIANISNEIIKKLKISEKAAKKGTWAYNILNGMN